MHHLRSFLENRSLLIHYVERIWTRVNFGRETWRDLPLGWGVFGDPLDVEWRQAWDITERLLDLFNKTVKADATEFLVLVLPEAFEYDKNWRPDDAPPQLKPAKAIQRLQEIAVRRGIALDSLGQYFQRVSTREKLQWPYFSHRCDTHFTAFGHEVLAEAITDRLEKQALLPVFK